jgi:hypothetical protein
MAQNTKEWFSNVYWDSIIKNTSCDADRQEISFYEAIINTLNGEVKDVDFLILTRIIDARKKIINKKE